MGGTEPILTYRFVFRDGTSHEFPVCLTSPALKAVARPRLNYPEWCRLSFCRCPNCPFEESRQPRCPAAESVIDVVEAFQKRVSTEQVVVDIATRRQTCRKQTVLSDGVSALMGVLMATSGCPVLGLLRPNALVHLPFASIDETVFRSLSAYLLAQYMLERRGGQGDWKLARLDKMLDGVHLVNRHFAERLRKTCPEDANVNALVHLDTFAVLTVQAARRMALQAGALEPLFSDYFAPKT